MRVSMRHAVVAVLIVAGAAVGLPASPAHALATTYRVTNTNDSGGGSLRDAIDQANKNKGIDSIEFALAGTGVHTITLQSALPTITESVIIDGYTQNGAVPATATVPATPTVVVDGTGTVSGLVVQASWSVIRGLVVDGMAGTGTPCGGAGICVVGDHNLVVGDYVGVNNTGTAKAPNTGDGVHVKGGNNWVGGPNPADRNVISGNGGDGVSVDGSDNHVSGNRIGTSADGTGRLGNDRDGVRLAGGVAHVGSTAGGAANLVSGNTDVGIEVFAPGCEIAGNLVGVNAAATGPLPNATGLVLHSNNNTVGGTSAGLANVLSGNRNDGLDVVDPAAGNTIQGNLIGVGLIGAASQPPLVANNGFGVMLQSGIANTLGGTAEGAGNTISGNGGAGVWVPGDNEVIQGNLVGVVRTSSGALAGAGNRSDGVRIAADDVQTGGDVPAAGNVISANGGRGVLVLNGVDNPILDNLVYGNGALDIDVLAGPAAPALRAGRTSLGNTTVDWALASTANTTFRLEFFANTACNTGGALFIGATNAVTDAAGNAQAPLLRPGVRGTSLGTATPAGYFLIATATAILPTGVAYGSTSDYSNCVPV